MAPTMQVQFTSALDMPQLPNFAKSVRRAHDLYQQRSAPKLWRRQNRADTSKVFETYTSPISLHANIIPLTMPASGSSRLAHLSLTEAILVSGGTLITVVFGVTALVMMRSIIVKKGRCFLCCGCGRLKAKKTKVISEDKGILVMDEEFENPTWGTPRRLVCVEGINGGPEDHHSVGPFLSPDTQLSSPSMPIWQDHRQDNSPDVCEGDSFHGRLDDEENDITLALSRALREISIEQEETTVSINPATSADDDASFLGHMENVSIFKSLQASIDNLANGISCTTVVNRPRQGSDASASSRTTTTTISPDVADCFSVVSSESSMTSLEDSDSYLDEEPEEMEVVYEVRRAHAQSIELKKGVLVTCRRASSTSDISATGSVPTFVISEAAPTLLSLDDQNFAPLFSLTGSVSSTASVSTCSAAYSLSSIIRENSRGTIASLSTSFSTTQGDDEQCLQPPIPCLMLTRPSDSSIYTTESFTSSASVDLCDFPLPPIPVKPSYYSRLVDQVQRRPKRIWDNHPADSNAAQKRSTVERFIMMYSP
ncbi:hypothetical protein C0991_011164 [Blastosporella zonata]|nr:hypothetical protein C0991_011164 [Blastosporella zonata]